MTEQVYIFPASFAQQRLWFLDQLVPGSAFYNIHAAIPFSRSITPAVLEQALNEIVRRHESLRTTFKAIDGEPFQVVAPELHLHLDLIDLRDRPYSDREAKAFERATEEARRPFDLTKAPLLRTALLQMDDAEFIFLLTMHHIICDGWSMGIFFSELSEICDSILLGRTPRLPELPVQYADFSVSQREWLESPQGAAQLAYWKRQLSDLPVLQLPTDRRRPSEPSYVGAVQDLRVPEPLYRALKELSQKEGVTVFMTLLAALDVLLSRYTSQDEIVLGSPTANRGRAELENLIGFFVNPVVLRTDVSGDPTFCELLMRVRETTLAAYEHQDLPFERLVQELRPERDMSRNPLFQASFQLFSSWEGAPTFADQDGQSWDLFGEQPLEIERGTAAIDFALDLWELPQGIEGTIEYSTDLFEPATVSRMAEHFLILLNDIVIHPEKRLSQLEVLSEAERHKLVVDWNDTACDYQTNLVLPKLFEAQVKRTPESVAVTFRDEVLNYRELNRRANRVANFLRQTGIGPESVVAICMERSPEMVIALLGISKAGGAYLPLDPQYPKERLNFLIHDAQPSLVLTERQFLELFSDYGGQKLCLDTEGDKLDNFRDSDPDLEIQASNLAYIIYTSGSTGLPKGVMVEHRAVCNHLLWMQAAFPLTKNDRIPQKYSISFDASVWEIFGPLLFGARLVLAEPGEHLDIDRLIDLFTTHQVTVLDVVPSMLNVLMEDERFLACRSLRRVTCGGETLPVKLQRSFFEHMTAELNNVYGPTEATIGATAWTCKPGYSDDNVPIGRPIANASIFVLDRYLNVVPIGVPGEIHIGGVCLARGYKNRPELDGEKFIANPFSKQSGAQLYKTGDVGRYLEDGTIQYLGRTDDQIKIRGFRVELGEIEVALGKHPSVEACSVSVREDQLGHAQLVAYIAPKTDNPELWPSVGEYFVYDDLLYYAMTHDERRNRAYRNAIECAVSGKTVLDIGTGADAIWARACVAAGAKRVYAIEMLDEAYTKALGLLTQLGLHDKIVLIHGDSTQVTLPELVDVCVSELLGTIGSSEGVVPILNDARRFLKNDGIMSPQRCVTKIAAVSLPEPLASQPRFSEGPAHYVEEVFKKVGRPFDLRLCIKYLPNKSIVSEAATFEDLNFLQQTPAEDVTNMTLTVTRDCRVDGFLCWLNLYPAEDELVDTLDGQSSWLPVLLPVFAPGLILETGDRIEMSCARISAAAGLVTPDYQLKGHVVRNSGAKTEFYYDAFSRPSYFRKTSFYDSLFKNSVIEEASLDTFESTSEHIFGWKKTYEDVYGRNLGESSQPELIGSNITCSGTPIPSDDIREQVRHTVSRILDLQPRRILDIGCGTGSLLFRMAPVSEYYVGTDIAPTALKYLSQELTARGLSNVSLLERSADNFDGLETGNFDTVVLNSVVQHFPDVDYFVRILQQAIELVCPAGFIFIGGLRNMSLLRAFHTSVELKRTAPFEPVRDVLERIRTRVNEERELLIEPLLFSGLRNNVRKIQRIEMQVKRGWQHNAMTEFCYDVVLQVGGDPDHQASFEKFDWEEISTVARLQHILAERNPETAVVQNVPSARLRREHDALKLFASADCPADMEQVLHLLSRKPHTAIEPEALWRISEELPYEVKVRWSGSGRESFYDVLLQRRSSTGQSRINDFLFADGGGAAWHRYANHPLRGDSRRALVPELRDFLKNRLPAHMVPAAFVVMQKLPVTPAGKIDRKALPAPDQSRPELAPSYERPRNEIEEALAGLWSQLLGVDRVGIHDNFFELGGDSILSIQLVARASRIGIHLSPAQLFQFQTVAELAKVAAKTGGVQAEQGLIKGNAPLLPIQKWLFEQNLPNVNHYNQSVLMCVPKALRADEVETVLNRLLMQHDALRLRFVCDESGWQQIFGELAIAVPVKHVDLTQLAMAEQMEALENECSKLQASFDLAVGPPICAALFNLGDSKSNRLFIAAHHLVIDGVSWRILLEDFEIAYEQLTGPQNIQLPAKTTSFQYWAQRLTEYANSAPLQAELSYWLSVPPSNPPKILTDHNTGQNNIASMRSVVISLTAEETERLLVDVPKAYHTQINDVLLTALAQVFERWTGEPQLFIDLEGHGREGIFENVDLSRTVGWFTTIFPVFLDLREAFSAEETLKSVKEQLRSIPNRGIGYGLLRYLCQYDETTRKLAALPRPEISFNYLGQFGGEEEDSEWRAASEATGPSLGLQQSRPYLFELNAAVYDGHFQVDWAYSENVHRRATIETLASDFKTGLSSLIDHCVSRNIRTYTPSDFSKAKLSQRDLDTLLSKLQRLAEA